MTKKFVFGVAVVALAMIVMAPSASASCNPGKNASTYGAAQSYWLPASGAGTIVGQAWQLGAPGTFNSNGGTVPCANFLYFTAGGANLNLDLGSCGAGCPAGGSTLAVLAMNQTATSTDFLLDTVVETPTASVFFDYSTQGSHNMVVLSPPNVISSSTVGTTRPLHISVPSHASALYGPNAASAITGYKIVQALSATDPGRNASAYSTTLATIAAAGGAAAGDTLVTADCTAATAGQDAWVATQLSLEGGAVLSPAVSAPKRVHCAGALADPKFKIVPKKGTGIGTVQH